MRIAVVNESFEETRGGAERAGVRLADALLSRGHTVARVARDERRGRALGALALAAAASSARGSVDVVVSLCRAPGDVVFPQEGVHAASVAGSLARHSPATRPIAALGKMLSPRQWAFLACELERAPLLANGRAPRAWAERLGRLAPRLRRAPPRRYIALSQRIRRDMIRFWRAPPEAIAVCPNGVDTSAFSPPSVERRVEERRRLDLRDDELVVAFVSNHYALRGLPQLIRALALAKSGVHLFVAGRGNPGRPARLARALGVRAHFLGPLPDVRALFAASDVFALPTFYDTCSLVTLEALASGLPVVTSRMNGAAELLSGDEGALIDDPREIGALAAALARLGDPKRRVDCGLAARETAIRNPIGRALSRVVEVIEGAAP